MRSFVTGIGLGLGIGLCLFIPGVIITGLALYGIASWVRR